MNMKRPSRGKGPVRAIQDAVEKEKSRILAVGRFIHAHPEPGKREVQAAERITACLRDLGFKIEIPYGGMATAFRARLTNGRERPRIAVLAEYDALEGLGHGCGHNLITVAALAAACAMARTREQWKGRFEVIGTPAEELLGGKCHMIEKRAFHHLDACFMTHPSTVSRATMPSNALRSFHAAFHGRAAHAAIAPGDGINALDAAILFFQHLQAMGRNLPGDARIHGIITEGGQACNVVPERAQVEVGVRSRDEGDLEALGQRVVSALRSAARTVGARASVRWEKHGYRPFRLNRPLDRVLADSFGEAGIALRRESGPEAFGSLDMGNVSQVVPAAHPWFRIMPRGREDPAYHTREFMEAADTPFAYRQALKAGTGMALAARRLFSSPEALRRVKREFEKKG